MSRSPGCVGAGAAVGGSAVSGAGALVRLAVGIITSPTAIEERVRLRQHLLNHQQLSLRQQQMCAGQRLNVWHRFVVGTRDMKASADATAALEREGDVLLLPHACGSGRCLAAKVLAWFRHAIDLTDADFYAKMDPDSYVVWDNLGRLLLDASEWDTEAYSRVVHGTGMRSPLIYAGRVMWSSFYRHARRWCGCCAGSLGHAANLHAARAPTWPMGGACVGPNACLAEGEPVDGPYPYATGPFYLLSHALVVRLTAEPFLARLARDLLREGEMDRELEWVEDVLVGWCVHQVRNVTVAAWPQNLVHNLDERKGIGACRRTRGGSGGGGGARSFAPLNFSLREHAGRTPGGAADTEEPLGFVGPASVIIHHVRSSAQWSAVGHAVELMHGAGDASGDSAESGAAGAPRQQRVAPCSASEAMRQVMRPRSFVSYGTTHARFTDESLAVRWPRGRIWQCNKTRVGSRR